MVKKKEKRKLIIIGSIAAAILLGIGIAITIAALTPDKQDPYKQASEPEVSQTETTRQDTADTAESADTSEANEDSQTALDPEDVSSIDIQPLSLTVSYGKDVGAFQYSVKRTASGTQYVEFLSEALAGTKCTDDQGAFVSILKNPDANESAAITKTKKLGDATYGLSLADDACTKDPALLKQYQAAFNDAFSLLKELNEP